MFKRLRPAERAFVGLVTLNIIIGLGCWGYQMLASANEARTFPPPGQLVDVGGYRLHLYCTGVSTLGQPTVILESGLGAPGLMWTLVQTEVANHRRVCSYDRAGYGWSDPGPAPRVAQHFVTELHTLLHTAGEQPPYLLVGHSLGSLIVRVYAATYPAEVVGLLFLDPRHADFFNRMPPEALAIDERNFRTAQWLKLTTPLGITRLLGAFGRLETFESYLAPLPDAVEAAAWARMIYRPEHWDTAVTERATSAETYAQAKTAPLAPDLPLTVLTAELGWQAWRTSDETQDAAGRTLWLALQEEQAHLTARGTWQVIPNGGHYLYFEQPQLIATTIKQLLDP